jgi:predicted nucleic acid-binding Zn ribbon protein
MTEDDLLICPVCLSEVKRVYNIPEVHYKGVGFYATDKNEPKRGKDGKIIEAMPGVT